ncbi:heparan-alpha-glucosaminide N-acetyltransferase [Methylobacterium sp. 77]|uniref:heparan-alpha-glucosaminide N-acetyltransferase n=1 Tax=Methylobacterium sp. 77 TaxID=1101192 RepID=UPI00036691C1|nr:heparan-alpha-glucosaminide N-acetyltransferase [Methylobacterium sp. 77]
MEPAATRSQGTKPRFDILDVARGIALLAMAAYHTTWDLGYLALTPENYALAPLGKVAAHLIAGAFLVLVGIGLVLMNRDGLRPRAFLLRLARIGGAALLITAATRYAMPDSYIFFGILHCIAVSSILAVPFLRVSPVASVVVGIVVLAAPAVMANPDYHLAVFDDPILSFLGLGMLPPRTNDYVPLFPWFGLVLLGLALARLGLPAFRRTTLPDWRPRALASRGLALAGRHSLAVYLVHQPVLLALLTGLVTLTGPHPKAGLVAFRADYRAQCESTGGSARTCRVAARCVGDALQRENLWAITGRGFTVEERAKAQALSQTCYDAADGPAVSP